MLRAAERFAHALRAAILTGAVDTGALHSALHAFVEQMREQGDPPERVLIAVKERVLLAMQRRTDVDRAEAGEFLGQIVAWTIRAYYRAD